MDTPTNNQTELYPDQHPPHGCTPSTNPRIAHQRIILSRNVTADLLREAKPLTVWTLEGQEHLALFLCPWLSGTLYSLTTPQEPSSGGCSNWPERFPRSRWQNNSGSVRSGKSLGMSLNSVSGECHFVEGLIERFTLLKIPRDIWVYTY